MINLKYFFVTTNHSQAATPVSNMCLFLLWEFGLLLFTHTHAKKFTAARMRKALTHEDLRASGWKGKKVCQMMQAEVALRLRRSERWGARPRRTLRCTRPRRAGTTRPCARCELGSNVNGKWLLTPEYTHFMQKNREQQRVCHVLLVFELIPPPRVSRELI